jgi:intein/homing endonuclease
MDQNLILELLEDYENKMFLKDLKKKYKTSSDTIYKLIKEYGVKKTNYKDLSIFKDITNKELQYWLGYICADGSIQYDTIKRVYKVSLFSKDEEVVLNFKKFFGDIVCLHYRSTSDIKEAYISSKELCEFFINELNITPKKAFTLDPNIDFTSNFILGYFDGDGSIANSTEIRTRYESKFTSGSESFLNKIKEITDTLDIYSIIRSKGTSFDLCYERKSESEKLYKYLYQDMKVCLSRKLNNFVALFGNIEK